MVLLTFLILNGRGQNLIQDSSTIKQNIIKWAPYNLLDFINTSIELSYERALKHNFSFQTSGAYLLPTRVLDWGSDFKTNSKGYRIRLEGRKYLSYGDKLLDGKYVAIDFGYLYNDYYSIMNFGGGNFYNRDSVDNSYIDTVHIKKQTIIINLKIGYQQVPATINSPVFKRLTLDMYVGIGLKYRNVKHSDRINPLDLISGTRHPNIPNISDKEGINWRIGLPVNFKIGYAF